MQAAVMRSGRIVVDELPDPEPGPGQVLVRTLACGICGSDLHALQHADRMVEAAKASGVEGFDFDPGSDVVFGHEFCAEILDFGPSTLRNLAVGDRVCSMPVVFHPKGVSAVGYSNVFPGGYGERMLLSEPLLLPVPNGLSSEHAALTEPLAVGVHAVARARMQASDAALVIGCGPVGLAVVAALRLAGHAPVIAADFSPRRRALAEALGADTVVDPAVEPAIEAFRRVAGPREAVIFECVGVPGVIDRLMRDAPRASRIVVAGVCMEDDRIWPIVGVNKELNIQFVLGYAPDEFARALRAIAEGEVDVAPWVTGEVGIDGVAGAFTTLGNPDAHAKILVKPSAA